MREAFTDEPIAAYTIGPYSLAGLLSGTENTAMNTILQPELLHETLNLYKCIDVYGKALIEAGAEGICILEPSGSLLSPQMYEEFPVTTQKSLRIGATCFSHICGTLTILSLRH